MNFDQKLNTLMNLFKINNSKLSRGIDVDASLISRWKSGERKIAANSPHIPKLASFFLHLNAYHYQKEYLEKIIAARLPEKERMDDASRVHVLADWLISAEAPEPQPFEQPEQLAQSVSLIASMSQLLAADGKSHKGSAELEASLLESIGQDGRLAGTIAQPAVIPGQNCTYELFQGRAGKRQVVLNLLCKVLESTEKLDLLLTSEDDTQWMTEDRGFTLQWYRLLRQVIEKGHQITLIHVVNRRMNEMMNMLNYWIPLHMAGRMNSFYYPRYGDRKIRQTLFVVKDHWAVISNTIADSVIDEPTYLYNNPTTVEQFSRLFMSHLSQCRPLFAVYTRESMRSYYSQLIDQAKKPGQTYSIRHQLNIRMLPMNIMTAQLLKTQGHLDGRMLTGWLTSLQQEFYNRLSQEHTTDVLPLSLLDQIQSHRSSVLPCYDVFSDKPITLGQRDTLAWLKQIVTTLRQYENYELYLCPENQGIDTLKVNIVYRENAMALFAPFNKEKRNNLTVMLNENNILHSLSYYFDDYIQQIPTSLRNKTDVIQRFERLIAALDDQESMTK